MKNYSQPDEYGEGDDINLEFKGELRDFQKDLVNNFLKSVIDDNLWWLELILLRLEVSHYGVLMDTPIMMYDGTDDVMVQVVKVGDQLLLDELENSLHLEEVEK